MRRLGLVLGAAFLLVSAAALIVSGRFIRIAISGHSMEPGLRDGDWLLVDRSTMSIRRGDVVVARDPRAPERLIVKRVGHVGTDAALMLVSDHPAHAEDLIGPVQATNVIGRARVRYWPLERLALVGSRSTDAPHARTGREAVAIRG